MTILLKTMKPPPTDLQILQAIWNRYYHTYVEYHEGDESRKAKVYVPVDCGEIANDIGSEGDIVFGRLYYDLAHRYSYEDEDKVKTKFYTISLQAGAHCIHFPYAASVLADLLDKKRQEKAAFSIAILALVISSISIAISLLPTS